MATMMVLFWGGLIAVVVLLVRGRGSGEEDRPAPRGRSAREILDERFARGEIDRDEYEDRRAALQG
jgi:putative membrane protein